MIARYSRKQMSALWSDEAKYSAWLKVELAVCDVYAQAGKITPDELKALHQASFSVDRIAQLEKETKHDVVAFTRAVSESLGAEKRWIHYGLTSTDVVDTATGLIMKDVDAILKEDLYAFQAILKQQALTYKMTPCMGRTHGIHAEITSFGLKFALWVEEFNRHLKRFEAVCQEIECGKISGAVGNCLYTGVKLQDDVCQILGLNSAAISTQTLQRDRHAAYFSVLALIATSLEKIALEFRHLQRTEVREVEEGFSVGQKGSSAMPHKRNPISFENITGLSRIIRGYMVSAYEDIPLWHERDISHSSVERIIFPDATILLDYMLNRMTGLITHLQVFPDHMLKNIALTKGVIFAQRVMNRLIDEKAFAREQAYDLIQPLAMKAWTQNQDFMTILKQDAVVKTILSDQEIDACFTLDFYLTHVDAIYQRVGL